ncbi:unnamed protein product [Ectocarpus sp. 12 AP-2014]
MARRDVLCEIQSVLDALRRNARFEIREHRSNAEESRLTADLKALREAVRDWPNEDLRGLSRLELVSPFLSVVRSPETNGVLTEAALRSLQAFSRGLGTRLRSHRRPRGRADRVQVRGDPAGP